MEIKDLSMDNFPVTMKNVKKKLITLVIVAQVHNF